MDRDTLMRIAEVVGIAIVKTLAAGIALCVVALAGLEWVINRG